MVQSGFILQLLLGINFFLVISLIVLGGTSISGLVKVLVLTNF